MTDDQQKNLKPPKLVSRRSNKNSNFRMGRTIGAKREKIETANERAAASKKAKNKKKFRIGLTLLGFLVLAVVLIVLCFSFISQNKVVQSVEIFSGDNTPPPTIEIIDEAAINDDKISSRMLTYIGQAERAFRDAGYQPIKVVVPSNGIREVDFYLKDHSGFIKLVIDRGVGVSVEDADRMLRYLDSIGVKDFTYIDVRIDQKAYWK